VGAVTEFGVVMIDVAALIIMDVVTIIATTERRMGVAQTISVATSPGVDVFLPVIVGH